MVALIILNHDEMKQVY